MGFINTYVRISFKFISLSWTYKHRYAKFINDESEQEMVCTTNIYTYYFIYFYFKPLSKKFISRYTKFTKT